MKTLPSPDPHGLFEPVIGPRPEGWPFALPHLYALNAAGEVVESIGYWKGAFAVYDKIGLRDAKQTIEMAERWFGELPVRYLMEEGRVLRVREEVEVTGEWPTRWEFGTFVEVRIFTAYLFEIARARGGKAEADRFHDSLRFAYPMTEFLLSYRESLDLAGEVLAPYLGKQEKKDLRRARKAIDAWVR